MYTPSRPIHNPLAKEACKNILDELEHFNIIEPIPLGSDNYEVKRVPFGVDIGKGKLEKITTIDRFLELLELRFLTSMASFSHVLDTS